MHVFICSYPLQRSRELAFSHHPMLDRATPSAADKHVAGDTRCYRVSPRRTASHVSEIVCGGPEVAAGQILTNKPVTGTVAGGAIAGDIKIAVRVSRKRAGPHRGCGRELIVVHGAPGGSAIGALPDHPVPVAAAIGFVRSGGASNHVKVA